MSNNYITFLFEIYADVVFWISTINGIFPYELVLSSIDTCEEILKAITPPTPDAHIQTDMEEYEKIVLHWCSALASIWSSEKEGEEYMLENQDHTKLIIEVGKECLKERKLDNLNSLRKITEIFESLTSNANNNQFEDISLYPFIFEILSKCEDQIIEENCISSIENSMSKSVSIFNELTNPEEFNLLCVVSWESKLVSVKNSVCEILYTLLYQCEYNKDMKNYLKYLINNDSWMDKLRAVIFDWLESFKYENQLIENGLELCRFYLKLELGDEEEIWYRLQDLNLLNKELELKLFNIIQEFTEIQE